MKAQSKTDSRSARRRMLVRRFGASLGIVVGVAVMGTAFASVRARVVSKPKAPGETRMSLPQEWVWQKDAVVLDDMFRE